ncbi:PIG-L deacetylase family protein [Candidatus Latescibacterota bacterium]
MKRRHFVGSAMAGGTFMGGLKGITEPTLARAQTNEKITTDFIRFAENLVIDRDKPGKPHKGKVFAAIQPHADDIPLAAPGIVCKLLNEGYKGYLIRVTNEDKSAGGTVGQAVAKIEQDNINIGKVSGFEKVYDLAYRKHDMEDISVQELRARLIFLFRLLKIDTIITYDPWTHNERNPDHYITSKAVEAAIWHSHMSKDYPEHFKAGLKPQRIPERYYHGRGSHDYEFILFNRIVDVSSYADKIIEMNMANANWGPLSRSSAEEIREEFLEKGDHSALGRMFGFKYAEAYHYKDFDI